MSEQPQTPAPDRERPHSLPSGADLSGFPAKVLRAGSTLYRAHASENGCWYFSHLKQGFDTGRFDLPSGAGSGLGTCYLAANPLTALAERLGPKMLVGPEITSIVFDECLVATVTTRAPFRLANLTHRACARYRAAGRELSVVVPYAIPQSWAQRWAGSGFAGVHYYPRHDAKPSARSVALFGPAGGHKANDAQWPEPPSEPAAGLLARFARAYGLTVVPPSVESVDIISDGY